MHLCAGRDDCEQNLDLNVSFFAFIYYMKLIFDIYKFIS